MTFSFRIEAADDAARTGEMTWILGCFWLSV